MEKPWADSGLERQTQLDLWALGAAPFILGADLPTSTQQDLDKYLKNTAVLAVDQDAIAAKRVVNSGNQQVFAEEAIKRRRDRRLIQHRRGRGQSLCTGIRRGPGGECTRLFLDSPFMDGRDENNWPIQSVLLSRRMGSSCTVSGHFDSVQLARRLRSMLAVQIERARDFAAIASATS